MKYIVLFLTLLTALPLANANRVSDSQRQFIKQYEKQKLKVAPEDALLNTDAEPCLKEGFVSLYNGENLDGWTPRGGECTFEAAGESIVGTCVPGSPSTYLSTNKDDYGDFIFTAELKWEVDGNSGIMFRAQSRPGKKFETVYGPQCEMEGFARVRNWSGGIYGQSAGGWRYPLWLEAHAEARKALKKDIWNRVTIMAVGNTVKTWINGVPAAHWVDDEYKSGFFSLQIHSGQQGKVHFRNIKVKELTANTACLEDLFSGNSFSKWQTVSGDPVEDGWSIENGVVCLHTPGKRSIITKTRYADFELLFDWKISIGGNSGVKYRLKEKYLGLEYQILDDQRHKDGKIPSHRAGSLYDLVAAPDDKPVNPVGEWNCSRIVAKGNHIEHWLNGALVAEITINSDDWNKRFQNSKFYSKTSFGTREGPIHLQDHNDVVWYRNVRIREL